MNRNSFIIKSRISSAYKMNDPCRTLYACSFCMVRYLKHLISHVQGPPFLPASPPQLLSALKSHRRRFRIWYENYRINGGFLSMGPAGKYDFSVVLNWKTAWRESNSAGYTPHPFHYSKSVLTRWAHPGILFPVGRFLPFSIRREIFTAWSAFLCFLKRDMK